MSLNSIKIVDELLDTFFTAGKLSLEIRDKNLVKKTKSDNTPVTNGDIEVNNILTKKISELTPEIPIVSEESSKNKENSNLKNFWLIDPIDGTYDYINGRDEFTLNAALIKDYKPFLGIIYAPAKKRMFYSFGPDNAYEIKDNNTIKLECSKNFNKDLIKFVSYSNKIKPEIEKIHKKLNVKKFERMKSSLKFCAIAAGEYDGYVAEPRAYEWDIAAGHAILSHAGGKVTDFNDQEIKYGKKDFRNPSLILKSKHIS